MQEIVGDILRNEFENMLARLKKELTDIIHEQMQIIKAELENNMDKTLQVVEQRLIEISESANFVNNRLDDVDKEQKSADRTMKDIKNENMILKSNIISLTNKINYMEQKTRASNIEIQCLPEKRNENLYNVIKQIGRVISCDIEDNHILHCTRTAKLNSNNTRPRAVVVQFISARIRDTYLAACIKFNKSHPDNKLNVSHLGYSENRSPIYICEHLSPTNKSLHAATRLKAKEKGFKYVWIRNGKIFARKDDTSEHIFIRDTDTLSKLK